MQVSLRNKGLFKMTMGKEIEPHHPAEKNKLMNRLGEAFEFLCAHISRDLLFDIVGLSAPKEAWEKLELLFGKKDELRGYILEKADSLTTKQFRDHTPIIYKIQVSYTTM